MFSQFVLEIINKTAKNNVRPFSQHVKTDYLALKVRQLTGYQCEISNLNSIETMEKVIDVVGKHLEGEQNKSRRKLARYNHVRHLDLLDLIQNLNRKRDELHAHHA